MEQKSLTKLSWRIVTTQSYLGFLTLSVGLVAGSHAAIAQTIGGSGSEHRLIDRILVADQQLETPGSGNSKNFNISNYLIAGGDRQDRHEDRRDRREDRRDRHDGEHGKKKPEKSELIIPLKVQQLKMPNPMIIGGDGE